MSSLTVYHESSPDLPSKVLTHVEDIASTLAEVGVRFERWEASAPIAPGASQDEVIAAYRPQIDRLMQEQGYITPERTGKGRKGQPNMKLRATRKAERAIRTDAFEEIFSSLRQDSAHGDHLTPHAGLGALQ